MGRGRREDRIGSLCWELATLTWRAPQQRAASLGFPARERREGPRSSAQGPPRLSYLRRALLGPPAPGIASSRLNVGSEGPARGSAIASWSAPSPPPRAGRPTD
eukprot:tig00000123_g6928.t1